MSADTVRVPATSAVPRAFDRSIGAAYLLVGAALLYLVLFDQGAALALVVGPGSWRSNFLHEFFHDGRHLWNAACH